MSSLEPLTDDFEKHLQTARHRERTRFRLFGAVWIIGSLALVGLAYSWNSRLSAVQQELNASQDAVKTLRTAADAAAAQAKQATNSVAAIDALSAALNAGQSTLKTDQATLRNEQVALRKQLETQQNTRQALETQLVTLNTNLNAANVRLRAADDAVVAATTRVAEAAARADRANAAAAAAIQSAEAASNTAAAASTIAQGAQTQATQVTLNLTLVKEQAEARFRDIERSLRRAHFTFITNKANQILIDGDELFVYFSDWNKKEAAVTELCVATTEDQAKPAGKGFILTRPIREAQPSRQNCLPLKLPGQPDVRGSLPLLKIGQPVTFDHNSSSYTVTPRYRIGVPILHDQIGFDVERELRPVAK